VSSNPVVSTEHIEHATKAEQDGATTYPAYFFFFRQSRFLKASKTQLTAAVLAWTPVNNRPPILPVLLAIPADTVFPTCR
jgi:hypothetical protein